MCSVSAGEYSLLDQRDSIHGRVSTRLLGSRAKSKGSRRKGTFWTYTLVDVVPDAVRDRVKGHLGGKGGDKDGGEKDRVALDDGVVSEARKLVGGGGVVGLDRHGGDEDAAGAG